MNIITKITFLFIMLILYSCNAGGGGGGEKGKSSTQTNKIETNLVETALVLNVKTEILEGQSYIAKSDDALVTIEHDEVASKKYITLTQGEGVIVTR